MNHTMALSRPKANNHRYHLINFIAENSKGDLYKVLQGMSWYLSKGLRNISRSALASFAKCHVDTVSSINMRLEKAAIVYIERAFKQINTYSTDFLLELKLIFNYASFAEWSSAFLLDPFSLSLSKLDTKCARESEILDGENPKNHNLGLRGANHGKVILFRTPVLCPSKPYDGVCEIKFKEIRHDLNVNLLFPSHNDDEFIDKTAEASRLEKAAAEAKQRSRFRILSHEESLARVSEEEKSNGAAWEEFRLKLAGFLST